MEEAGSFHLAFVFVQDLVALQLPAGIAHADPGFAQLLVAIFGLQALDAVLGDFRLSVANLVGPEALRRLLAARGADVGLAGQSVISALMIIIVWNALHANVREAVSLGARAVGARHALHTTVRAGIAFAFVVGIFGAALFIEAFHAVGRRFGVLFAEGELGGAVVGLGLGGALGNTHPILAAFLRPGIAAFTQSSALLAFASDRVAKQLLGLAI